MNAQENELKVTDLPAQQLPSGHNLNKQLSSLKITHQDSPTHRTVIAGQSVPYVWCPVHIQWGQWSHNVHFSDSFLFFPQQCPCANCIPLRNLRTPSISSTKLKSNHVNSWSFQPVDNQWILQTWEEIQYILGGISSHTFSSNAESTPNDGRFDREPLILSTLEKELRKIHTKVWKTFKQTYKAVWIFQIILQHSWNSASSYRWCIKHRQGYLHNYRKGAHDV